MRNVAIVLLPVLLVACGGGGSEEAEPEESSGSYTETLGKAYQGGFTDRTRGDMSAIGAALAQYLIDAGSYPSATDIGGLAAALEPAYSRNLPRTDAWGQAFQYRTTGSGFLLTSVGRDGRVGTADDLVLAEGGMR